MPQAQVVLEGCSSAEGSHIEGISDQPLYACETWANSLETISSLEVYHLQCLTEANA